MTVNRKIIHIDQEKCNGCGLCVEACHEGAIQMVDGKATLISDKYCDGLGDCLPECPTKAITIIEREAEPFSEEAVQELKRAKETSQKETLVCGCPGTMSKVIERGEKSQLAPTAGSVAPDDSYTELKQWPVQLRLINPAAEYLQDCHLLIAADCTAFAYGNFHQDYIKGRITVIGCPKLDDLDYYREKLTQILAGNRIKSITVVRMEVPCCHGIVNGVKEAMLNSRTIVPYQEVVIGIDGTIKSC